MIYNIEIILTSTQARINFVCVCVCVQAVNSIFKPSEIGLSKRTEKKEFFFLHHFFQIIALDGEKINVGDKHVFAVAVFFVTF